MKRLWNITNCSPLRELVRVAPEKIVIHFNINNFVLRMYIEINLTNQDEIQLILANTYAIHYINENLQAHVSKHSFKRMKETAWMIGL